MLCLAPVPPLPCPADPRVEDHRPVLSVTALGLFQLGQPPGEAAHTEAQRGPGHSPLDPRPVGSRAPVRSSAPVRGEAGQGALGRG